MDVYDLVDKRLPGASLPSTRVFPSCSLSLHLSIGLDLGIGLRIEDRHLVIRKLGTTSGRLSALLPVRTYLGMFGIEKALRETLYQSKLLDDLASLCDNLLLDPMKIELSVW